MNTNESPNHDTPPPHPLSGEPVRPEAAPTLPPPQDSQDQSQNPWSKNASLIRLAIAGSGLLSLTGLVFLPLGAILIARAIIPDHTPDFNDQLLDELNFQIVWLIVCAACALLAIIGAALGFLLVPLILLLPAIIFPFAYLGLTIWSMIKISENPRYKHNFSYKLV